MKYYIYFIGFIIQHINLIIASNQNFAVFGYLPEYRLNNFDYDGAF